MSVKATGHPDNYFNLSYASIKSIEKCGTVLQIVVPSSTFLYSAWMQDYRGLIYIGIGLGVNQIAIEVLKRAVPRARPSGHRLSFPSGHTMATAYGAVSLIKRYGIKNVPSVLVITSCTSIVGVGFSRVMAKAHWVSDVVVGAVLGSLIGYLIPSLG